jgi:hypothetical protein
MNLNLLLFLEARASTAKILEKSGKFASYLKKRGDSYALYCQLVSIDPYYVHVKVPCPLKESLKSVAALMIPHASICLAIQSDQKKVLGFGQD